MCREAEEIQEFRTRKWVHPLMLRVDMCNLNEGDFFYNGHNTKPYQLGHNVLKFDIVWLPRQDQLQEMVKDRLMPYAYITLQMFTKWFYISGELDAELISQDDSQTFEQLWLKFVMQEKYKKQWDGKKWITK